MLGAFASAVVDMSDEALDTTFGDHLARCGGDAQVHTGPSWLVTALAESTSEARGIILKASIMHTMFLTRSSGNIVHIKYNIA
jgi:hypothetical protein